MVFEKFGNSERSKYKKELSFQNKSNDFFSETYMRPDPWFLNVILVFVDLDDESEPARIGGHQVAGHAGLDRRIGPREVDLPHVDLKLAFLHHPLQVTRVVRAEKRLTVDRQAGHVQVGAVDAKLISLVVVNVEQFFVWIHVVE